MLDRSGTIITCIYRIFKFTQWWWWYSSEVVSDSCHPMDCSPPGSSAHGILQARKLQWVAISFSKGSSWSRDQTQVSCITGRFFTNWATREAWHGLQKSSAALHFIFPLCWMFLLLLVWCSSTCFLLSLPLLWRQIQSIAIRPMSRKFSPRFSSEFYAFL